jgi:hypothetical protein
LNIFAEHTDAEFEKNIAATYDRADSACHAEGMSWYSNTNALAAELAGVTGLATEQVAAIFAVMSPRASWGTNVRNTAATLVEAGLVSADDAVAILERHGFGPDSKGVWRLDEPRGLPNNVKHARALAAGEAAEDHVKGPKVSAFLDNIARPSTSRAVTVDSWAAGVAIGRRVGENETKDLTLTQRQRIIAAYQAVADRLGLRPHELQATAWCEVRNATGWGRHSGNNGFRH